MEQRLLSALSRPLVDDSGKVLGTAGSVLLDDIHTAGGSGGGGRSEGGASGSGSGSSAGAAPAVGWLGRAQVVFGLVDVSGAGWVGQEECEALARAFLHSGAGGGGEMDGALREYLEDLQNEGMLDAAVAAEAESMMQFAEDGKMTTKGFSLWLHAFMSNLEEEVGIGGLQQSALEEGVGKSESEDEGGREEEEEEEEGEEEEKEEVEREEGGEKAEATINTEEGQPLGSQSGAVSSRGGSTSSSGGGLVLTSDSEGETPALLKRPG